MLLRFNNPHPTIVEISGMEYDGTRGVFYLADGSQILTAPIPAVEWQRLVSDMFVDGKLSYPGKVVCN